MASSSSSSSVQVTKKNDIFISFRGEDTRHTITGILYGRLYWEYHIKVFMDDQLNKGDEISPSLINAIEESLISVIVFSEGYASSRWCLEELVKIMECRNTFRQIVVPVFFHVDPSDVRNQTGSFGGGFAKLVKSFDKEKLEKLHIKEEQFREKVGTWRNALTEAANLSGYTATPTTSLYGLTQKIARDILEMLNYLSSQVDDNDLVGIQPSIDYITKYLLGLDDRTVIRDIRVVGIWGMGGMGKTTLAEAIFKKVHTKFEASYFARNVREKSSDRNTLAFLRQELLSAILNIDWHSNLNFSYTKKRRLCSENVVIVFDDVTCFSQIEFLIGDLNCLGPGSRIVITTRDKQVLRNCGVSEYYIYKIEGLSHCGALQLFNRHAFQQNHPKTDYNELSYRVVQYARGVPLALKVLGSFLFNRPKEVWESAMSKLEIIPHKDIQKVLKVSYDELDDIEKNIFLDIACFLKWGDRDFVIDFLDACGFHAKVGINVLIDKCLVSISDDNKVTMHNLLQEMGWEIVRQESTKDPSERSRLWYHEDVSNVLEVNIGTKKIEGICLDMSKQREIIHLQPCALETMRKLRFFKLHNPHYEENDINKVYASQGLNSVSRELRYLCWHGCPLKSLQSNFHIKNLVALEMPHSKIEKLWNGSQLLKLKYIDLSYSKHLEKIEDLSVTPHLERLILEGCTSLIEISSSFQYHNSLATLNLRYCKNLQSLLIGIQLKSLCKVILSHCLNFKIFDPEISHDITELFLDVTAIEELPPSIENLSKLLVLNLKNCAMLKSLPSNICKLKNLEHLNLLGCPKLGGLLDSFGNLEALKELNLINCYIEELPNNLGQLSSLECLFLGKNNFESIPTSIIFLSKLSYLDVSYCERLRFLPELPCKLRSIDANNCISLEALSRFLARDISQRTRENFSNCFKLVDQNAFKEIINDFSKKFMRLRLSILQSSACICFPGNEIPDCFIFRSTGFSITINPYSSHRNLSNLLVCAVVEFRNYYNEGKGLVVGFECTLQGRGRNKVYRGNLRGWDYGTGPDCVDSDHVFLGYYSSSNRFGRLRYLVEMSIQFYVENLNAENVACCQVTKCGALVLI